MDNERYFTDGSISSTWKRELSRCLVPYVVGHVEMPFGKYKGVQLRNIPLKYLDETISVMPPNHFIRLVQRFVDDCMIEVLDHYLTLHCRTSYGLHPVPNHSISEIRRMIENNLEGKPKIGDWYGQPADQRGTS